jgi:hypothetical protein
MAQVTVKSRSIVNKIKNKSTEIINEELKDHFTGMANFAIGESPIWSGAYVKSFSFKSNNSSSRGRRIDGANWKFPKQTGSEADRAEGHALLMGDINATFVNNDPLVVKSYTLRNDSNHATFVEYGVGGPTGPKPPNGYRIFEQLRAGASYKL